MKILCAGLIFCSVFFDHLGIGNAKRQREIIDCTLYERYGGKYFLVRSFAPHKIGISCRNGIFVYLCPRVKDAWYNLVDPTLDLRESCVEDRKKHEWEPQWVINVQVQTVAVSKEVDADTQEEVVVGRVPATIQLKFVCELL